MRDFNNLSPAAERIVDAAEELIQRQGFNGFSYEDISQAVGIRKPSVHHHFATKAELATVVTQRYVQRFSQALEALDLSEKEPRKRLLAYAQLFQTTYEQNRRMCLCGMLGAESETLPDPVRAELQRFFEINLAWLAQVLTQAQPSQAPQAGQLAVLLLSAMEGSMIIERNAPVETAPLQAIHAFLGLWTN